jgi:hypothetical protein
MRSGGASIARRGEGWKVGSGRKGSDMAALLVAAASGTKRRDYA